MSRVYSENGIDESLYIDERIEFWVDQFSIYKQTDDILYGAALAEIYAFEAFLTIPTSELPNTEDREDTP